MLVVSLTIRGKKEKNLSVQSWKVINHITLTEENGRITECKFDKNGNMSHMARGIKKGEKVVIIDEFCCFGPNASSDLFKKFNDMLVSNNQCMFRDGLTKSKGKAATFSPSEHNRNIALNEYLIYSKD